MSQVFLNPLFGEPVVCPLDSRGFCHVCGFRDFCESSSQLLVCSSLSCLRCFRRFRDFCLGTCFCYCYCDPRGVRIPQMFAVYVVVKIGCRLAILWMVSPQSWQTFARSSPPKCFEFLVLIVSSSAKRPKHPERSCIEGCEQ